MGSSKSWRFVDLRSAAVERVINGLVVAGTYLTPTLAISESHLHPGETSETQIHHDDSITGELQYDAAEADIADVKVGQAATISFPAITGASSKAAVTAIAPTGTTSNSIVTYATTITLTDPPKNLRIGQTADVTITTSSTSASALYVPAAAIST